LLYPTAHENLTKQAKRAGLPHAVLCYVLAGRTGCTHCMRKIVLELRFYFHTDKKRPNTIPVFGPGKWLLGESRALKVGINAG
jgi:predicted transcriptional regulator